MVSIEEVFAIGGRGDLIAVAGRVLHGKIHNKASVFIVDSTGYILATTSIIDFDWFGRFHCGKHVTVEAGMNLAILMAEENKKHLQVGGALVYMHDRHIK